MRIDLHVHSKHSKRPAEWFLKKIGCPESFTEPFELYEIAKNRGMTHITITDHNSIDGALEIAHLPDTFVSEEVTSYFPEDGCKMHILALDITENQHREIQKLRPNVYDLCAYFKRENIFNILAHPLYSLNDRLTAGHFERMLLLFENFELNGARNSRENQVLKTILNTLSPEDISQAADKHNLQPLMANAHRKRLFGGSDDHSSLNIARTYTEFAIFRVIILLFQLFRQGASLCMPIPRLPKPWLIICMVFPGSFSKISSIWSHMSTKTR